MKQVIKGLILFVLFVQADFVVAEIFSSEDSHGNVTFSDKPSANSQNIQPNVQPYRYLHHVAKIYDGDTIELKNGKRVRLLGINTPEINSRHHQGEAGGETAKFWVQDKLKQGLVYLEYDQKKYDKYNRELAHCFLPDGEHLNETILHAGLASLTIIPPNLRYVDKLKKAQQVAFKKQQGIWGLTEYQPILIAKLSKAKSPLGWQRFLATAKRIKVSRKYTRLILNNKVNIRIPNANLDLFPKLETYLDQSLEVRGWASRSKDHFSILIRHPSSIIILEP